MLSVFEKSERLRHIGHLDLMRAMQRALRRSGLPIAYSHGFNPHIQMSFASALTVGAIGKREIMCASLVEEVSEAEYMERMNHALPPELQLISAKALDDRHPAPMAMIAASAWSIEILDEAIAEKLFEILPAFLEREEILATRKSKSGEKQVNIRPMIYELTMEGKTMHLLAKSSETENCKPDMLLTELCKQAGIEETPRIYLTREQLYGMDGQGSLAPLENL